jgi:hypothetical protein
VVSILLELLPDGSARGTASLQAMLPSADTGPDTHTAEPQHVTLIGRWDEASGRVWLEAAEVKTDAAAAAQPAPKCAVGFKPPAFAGSYADGKLQGTWTYGQGVAAQTALWFVSATAPPAAETALTKAAPAKPGGVAALVAAEAAAALEQGLAAAVATSASNNVRCSRNTLMEQSSSLVRAV